jgi:hypothetical protein
MVFIRIYSKKYLIEVHCDPSRVKIAQLLNMDKNLGYFEDVSEIIWEEELNGKIKTLCDQKVRELMEKHTHLNKIEITSSFAFKNQVFEKNNEYKIKKMESNT